MAFRLEPENDLWAADVAFVRRDCVRKIRRNDNLHGSPDLVIEVESPSNTAAEFEERETMCMRTGCQEFWVIYPELQRVRVSNPNGVRRYEHGQIIALTVLPGVKIAVDDIFASKE